MPLLWFLACSDDGPSTETGTLGLCEDCVSTCVEEFETPTASAHAMGDVTYPDPPPSSHTSGCSGCGAIRNSLSAVISY